MRNRQSRQAAEQALDTVPMLDERRGRVSSWAPTIRPVSPTAVAAPGVRRGRVIDTAAELEPRRPPSDWWALTGIQGDVRQRCSLQTNTAWVGHEPSRPEGAIGLGPDLPQHDEAAALPRQRTRLRGSPTYHLQFASDRGASHGCCQPSGVHVLEKRQHAPSGPATKVTRPPQNCSAWHSTNAVDQQVLVVSYFSAYEGKHAGCSVQACSSRPAQITLPESRLVARLPSLSEVSTLSSPEQAAQSPRLLRISPFQIFPEFTVVMVRLAASRSSWLWPAMATTACHSP